MTPEQQAAAPRERRSGRPPRHRSDKNYWDTDLHKALVPHFEKADPDLVYRGRIDTGTFARVAGVARWTVYRWFRDGISARSVGRIISITASKENKQGTLTAEDLRPFIKIG